MSTITQAQQQLVMGYLQQWWTESYLIYAPTPPADMETTVQLIDQGRMATITVEDLLEGLEVTLVPPTDLPYGLVYQSLDGAWHTEIPFCVRSGASIQVNNAMGGSVTFRTGPSPVLVAGRPETIKRILPTLSIGSVISVFEIEGLKHNLIEAHGVDETEVRNLAKASVSWLGRELKGQPLEYVLYSDETTVARKDIAVDLPQSVGLDVRTPIDYFLYGISAQRRIAAYLAFYHVLEFYMGEVEVSELQAAIRTVYATNHRISDREFAVSLMREYSLTRRSQESDLLDACIGRLSDSAICEIVRNRENDLPVYTTDYGLAALAEAINYQPGRSSFKEQARWNTQHLRGQLSRRIYTFRNGLVHSKAAERTNISLQTLESAEWARFDIGLTRDLAYALLCAN